MATITDEIRKKWTAKSKDIARIFGDAITVQDFEWLVRNINLLQELAYMKGRTDEAEAMTAKIKKAIE